MMLQDKTSILTDAKARLTQAGIELHVTKKHVKNINFRLQATHLDGLCTESN